MRQDIWLAVGLVMSDGRRKWGEAPTLGWLDLGFCGHYHLAYQFLHAWSRAASLSYLPALYLAAMHTMVSVRLAVVWQLWYKSSLGVCCLITQCHSMTFWPPWGLFSWLNMLRRGIWGSSWRRMVKLLSFADVVIDLSSAAVWFPKPHAN